jgi:hypothetical protein
MPKLVGVRERRHQPYWDTLIRADVDAAPTPTVANETQLFNGTNLGLEYWTNMNIAGAFASDNTYVVLALRVWLWFKSTNALIMYQLAVHQMFLQFIVGDKPQFAAQAWYFPSGGGIWGHDWVGNVGNAYGDVLYGCARAPEENLIVWILAHCDLAGTAGGAGFLGLDRGGWRGGFQFCV